MDYDEVVNCIKSCIVSVKGGLPINSLSADFKTNTGRNINPKQFGFDSLYDLLDDIPEIWRRGDTLFVRDDKTDHLAKLVSKQKGPARYKVKPVKPKPAPRKAYRPPTLSTTNDRRELSGKASAESAPFETRREPFVERANTDWRKPVSYSNNEREFTRPRSVNQESSSSTHLDRWFSEEPGSSDKKDSWTERDSMSSFLPNDLYSNPDRSDREESPSVQPEWNTGGTNNAIPSFLKNPSVVAGRGRGRGRLSASTINSDEGRYSPGPSTNENSVDGQSVKSGPVYRARSVSAQSTMSSTSSVGSDDLQEPFLFNYQLVGDDYFLVKVASLILGLNYNPTDPKLCPRLCNAKNLELNSILRQIQNKPIASKKVILMVGLTDILKGRDLEVIKTTLLDLLDRLRGTSSIIVVLTVPSPPCLKVMKKALETLNKYNNWLLSLKMPQVCVVDLARYTQNGKKETLPGLCENIKSLDAWNEAACWTLVEALVFAKIPL